MKKIICVAITITIALLPALGFTENKPQETLGRLQEKKIVMIIAQRMFQETEFKEPKEIFKKNKILAAICMAPRVLANAGLLEGKKATSAHKYDIEAKGAICTDRPVERDGNIITANGPGAARQFGEAIVYALSD